MGRPFDATDSAPSHSLGTFGFPMDGIPVSPGLSGAQTSAILRIDLSTPDTENLTGQVPRKLKPL